MALKIIMCEIIRDLKLSRRKIIEINWKRIRKNQLFKILSELKGARIFQTRDMGSKNVRFLLWILIELNTL